MELPDGRRLLKQNSAGQLGSSSGSPRQPLFVTRGRQWSLATPASESDQEDNDSDREHSLLQIKLIEKNHSLLKHLSQLHAPRYAAIGKELEKTLSLSKSTESYLKDTTTLLDKTAEMHNGTLETLDAVLELASTIRFPDKKETPS